MRDFAEPASTGTGSVNTSTGELWKYLQAANVTAKAPHDLVIEAGLFTSPIGIEVVAVKDNWNWSRSNVFFGLPAYHVGAMVSHSIGPGWTGKLHLYNGWNSVVDIRPLTMRISAVTLPSIRRRSHSFPIANHRTPSRSA